MVNQDTLALLGVKDPGKALEALSLFSGAQQAAEAQKANAAEGSDPQPTFESLWQSKYGAGGGGASAGTPGMGSPAMPGGRMTLRTLGGKLEPEMPWMEGEMLGTDGKIIPGQVRMRDGYPPAQAGQMESGGGSS